jgi:hypothetical protein
MHGSSVYDYKLNLQVARIITRKRDSTSIWGSRTPVTNFRPLLQQLLPDDNQKEFKAE